jgi:hypothetical protein
MSDTADLNELVKHWLARLEKSELPRPTDESGDTVRLRLLDGREVPFRLRPEGWQYSYRGARREPGSERMERAILGVLVALEAELVDPARETGKNSEVTRQGAHLRVGVQEVMRAGVVDELEAVQKAIEADPVLKEAGTDAWQAEARLSLAEAVLQHYHPDFDDRPKGERIDLLINAARHMDEVLRALEALQEFIQAGRLGGRARKKAAEPQGDVRAAELKDALDLKRREIGEILGVPLSDDDRKQGGHKGVANMIWRGRKLLKDNLQEEGYKQHIANIRTDLKRRHVTRGTREGLIERLLEASAGITGLPLGAIEERKTELEHLLDKYVPE